MLVFLLVQVLFVVCLVSHVMLCHVIYVQMRWSH
jgi:hypothetical protein